jgi:hypothetical protein
VTTVTVYAFKYYDAQQGDWFLGKGKRTWGDIVVHNWRAIEASAEVHDEAVLNADGVYRHDGK